MTELVRIADLLAEPLLSNATVVASDRGTEHAVVDVHWYDGTLPEAADQLVVCGHADVSPPYRLDALILRAQEAKAAGLLVIAGEPHALLSSIRLAHRFEIPVLWLHSNHPHQVLHELTTRVRTPELTRARTVELLLHRLSAKRSGQDILTAAGAVLGIQLSLVAANGSCILGEPVPLDTDLHLERPIPQRGPHLLVHPVLAPESNNRAAAWLACPFDRAADHRLDTLSAGLAMSEPYVRAWLTGQRAQADRDAAFQAQLLAEVMTGREAVSREVVEAAVSLGWRLHDWHVGVHLLCDAPIVRNERNTITDDLRSALAEHGVHLVAAVDRGDGWAMWTNSDTEPRARGAQTVLRAMRRVTAALPREWQLVAGIGRAHSGPAGLAETLGEARDAAVLARNHDFRPAVEHSDELGVARMLASWQQSDVTRTFAETTLAPIRDPAHSHLLTTLHSYLEHNGSVVLTAQILGIHRNTVTARLQQLREQLGVDLNDPSQRLALQVACRALGS